MKTTFKTVSYLFNGQPVKSVYAWGNGSFCVLTAGVGDGQASLCYLFDEHGAAFLPGQQYFACGAALSGGYALLMESDEKAFALYNNRLEIVYSGIQKFQIFGNDWYELDFGATKKLFNSNHELMAEGYGACKVFDIGYCLTDHLADFEDEDDEEVWRVYLPDGKLFGEVSGVLQFFGDGNRLVAGKGGCIFDVLRFDGKVIAQDVNPNIKKFPNGRFIVTYEKDDTEQMFEADGSKLSVKVKNGQLLSDGRFVSFVEPGHRIAGLYDSKGFLTKVEVWCLQQAGDYYLVEAENVQGRLFNDKMEIIGDGYYAVKAYDCFAFFECEGPRLEIFNRNGRVFSSDCL